MPAAAAPPWTLEYRQWQGFYGNTSFELRYEPTSSPWGFRAWSAHGYDEDHCASQALCYHDTFWGVDLTYQLKPTFSVYLGYENLYRDYQNGDYWHAMTHEGLRIGVKGFVVAKNDPRWSAHYDVMFVPADILTGRTVQWESRFVGTGGSYRIALRYGYQENRYVEAGWHSWGFNTRPSQTNFYGHIWLGPYVSFGMRF